MTLATLDPPAPAARPGPADLPRTAPAATLWSLAALAAMLLAFFLAAGLLDARTVDGAPVWDKPAKFALSFVVLFPTLALAVSRLSAPVQQGRTLRVALGAMAVAFATELAYIAARAGAGQRSHFNQDTPLDVALYGLMGIGAVTLVVVVGLVGWLALRDRAARLGPGTRLGVGIGFLGSAVLTLITAGYLSTGDGHFVGTPVTGATLPFLGWSAEVGDLRPAHFLALHAMQALPLLGLWLDRRATAQAVARRAMVAAAIAWALLTFAVFAQALMGLPLVRL